jgi:hypothetical protein
VSDDVTTNGSFPEPEDDDFDGDDLEDGDGPVDAREALRALVEQAGLDMPSQDEPPGPTDWRELAPDEAPAEWAELRNWVETLVRRYPHLDSHVVPACWFRHSGHVEALVALRDYERLAFFPSSPASSPYNFQVALGQIEARLREWTARAGCLGEHREPVTTLRPPGDDEWADFVAEDVAKRERGGS